MKYEFKPLVVASATLDQQAIVYPIAKLAVCDVSAGWPTDVKPGMQFRILEAGETVVETGFVRWVNQEAMYICLLEEPVEAACPIKPGQTVKVFNIYKLWEIMTRRRFQ